MIWALLPPLVSDYVFSDPIPRLNNTIICQQQACSTRKKVWNDGPGFCPSSLMNDGGFEEHLFCGSSHIALQKKKKCETMGLISLVGSPEPSVLRIRERSTITTKHLWKDQEKHLPTSLSQWCSVCSDLNWYCEWSVRVFYVKDFSSLIRVQYDTFLELAEATAEIETSLLLTGLVINCHVRLFVMTLNTNPSDLSHANLS